MASMKMNVTYDFPLHTRLMSRCWRFIRRLPLIRRLWWRVMWIGLGFRIGDGPMQKVRPSYPINGSSTLLGS